MQIAQHLRWFQQLRWRLSLLYTALTVVLIFVGLSIGELIGYYNYHSLHQPQVLASAVAENAQQLATYISPSLVNTEVLTLWLKDKNEDLMDVSSIRSRKGRLNLAFYGNPSIKTVVTDAKGVVLVSQPADIATSRLPATVQLPPSQAMLVNSALQGETDPSRLSGTESDGALIAASPVFDNNRQVRGALFVRLYAPFQWGVHLSKVASSVVKPLLVLITLATIGGIGFGLVTAQHLTRRLGRISTAADAWGRGDFWAVADDSAADELGQLARRLNLMATEVQAVLALRQELATMEERNRLARDLHDTVKQEVFALAMQIGAAQAMLNGSAAEAQQRLSEAEKLARQVQHDLVGIIKELEPTIRTGKDFEQALREHVADWSRQSGVGSEVTCDCALSLPPAVDRAFFRIVQEALANVARHSNATQARVQVTRRANGNVTLSVTDNGVGFKPGRMNGGMGLRNMRERAESLPGGWFKVESNGKGTCVTAGCDAVAAAKE